MKDKERCFEIRKISNGFILKTEDGEEYACKDSNEAFLQGASFYMPTDKVSICIRISLGGLERRRKDGNS